MDPKPYLTTTTTTTIFIHTIQGKKGRQNKESMENIMIEVI